MPEEIVQIALPEAEQPLVCGCDEPNITVTALNEVEGMQECSNCLRFSKFPLEA